LENEIYPSSSVVAQQTEEGLCLLHITHGKVHVLNSTAAFLWKCLDEHFQDSKEGLTRKTLAEKLCSQYEIAYEMALSDVNAFIEEAISNSIVSLSSHNA